ncbi:MAG: protein translocase subunit SecF [Buchnera aphidicola (Nurudea shiraii)]
MPYLYYLFILKKKELVYNFLHWKNYSFFISVLCLFFSIVSIEMYGFNWNIDFTGGFIFQIRFDNLVELNDISNVLNDVGLYTNQISYFGGLDEVIIRFPYFSNISITDLFNKIFISLNRGLKFKCHIISSEYVGPNVDENLLIFFFLSLFMSILCTSFYIFFRFSWYLSIGIILSLFHDLLLTLGSISFLYIEVSPIVIVSLLSIIGYSINDSIVISDRIRENSKKFKNLSFFDILNLSLTQTYVRTIITSATTFSVAAVLYCFGSEMIKNFSLIMMIGIFFGTLSSIYVSSSLSFQLYNMKRFKIKT